MGLSWNLMVGNWVLWRFRIVKLVLFRYPRWLMVAILKFLKIHLLPNCKSDWAETWWEASGWQGDSELLKPFSSISTMKAILSILNHICTELWVKLSRNLVGIGAAWRFRNAKSIPFRYPQWPPWWPSWNLSNNLRFRTAKDNLFW